MWKNKRVLVTGSSGVIGRVLVKLLANAGANVLSVDIRDRKSTRITVDHIQVDLSKDIPVEISDFEPQAIFHLAATFERTVETAGYWLANFENNVLLSHRLLQTVAQISSVETFVFASSYLIYDPYQYLNVRCPRYIKETNNVRPRNLVGVAKYLFEQELDFVSQASFRAVSARIYRVYGRGSRDIISRWIRLALAGNPIEVWDEWNAFDYVFADDVAKGLLKLAYTSEGVVNLGSGTCRTINDVVVILKSYVPNLESEYTTLNHQREASAADMHLFEHYTGWTPQMALEEGIKNIIEYEKGN